MGHELRSGEVARYLRLLGVAEAAPSTSALQQLVRAHLCRVPFENLSKLWRARRSRRQGLPSLDLFLDGIERHRFGGTCYANNFHLYRLLRTLGYDASLCGADMPSGSDVHLATRVRVDGGELLIDVGYAAPFYEPLPLDLPSAHVVPWGRDTYVLHPRDAEGRTRLELWRDGARVHGYVLNPRPRGIEHFRRVIGDSFRESATFLRSLMLVRFFESRSVTILNRLRIDSTRDHYSLRDLATLDRVVEEVVRAFEIDEATARAAIAGLSELVNPYG